jgi:hypothetical protein
MSVSSYLLSSSPENTGSLSSRGPNLDGLHEDGFGLHARC